MCAKRVVTVVGARPQFIKASPVCRALQGVRPEARVEEVIVHTGQHYDENMSRIFFDELDIPRPKYNLGIGGGRHGEMTGRMLSAIEDVLLEERPDLVMVYGDTNSTLAGALAAVKLHIPVAHVEAGLRSFNMAMPEEINRIVADRLSALLFCPTEAAVRNLRAEGAALGVHQVGDVMFDASLFFRAVAQRRSTILERLGLAPKAFALATCHRAENADDPTRLAEIVSGLEAVNHTMPVVLPLHPRTRLAATRAGLLDRLKACVLVDPLPFLDMLRLEQEARVIITDSGGVQKEAFFYGVPCVTMRDETEWVETVELGWNTLAGADGKRIAAQAVAASGGRTDAQPYGDGRAAARIAAIVSEC